MIELPAEILEIIIEIVIAEYKISHSNRSNAIKFLPQSYLIPLLHVSNIWYQLVERYLYQSIAIGSKFPRQFLSSPEGESFEERREYLRRILETQPKRPGHIIAETLVNTLAKNSRLASLVKELQLGIEDDNHDEVPEWTLTIISIIRLCPNVEHVEIRGFHYTKLDKLMMALKAKSLVSFHIGPRNLSNLGMRGGTASQLFEAMQNWPKLRSLTAEGFLDITRRGEPLSAEAAQVVKCCPELRTLIFTGSDLDATDLKALRTMCTGVTNLHVPIQGGQVGSGAEEALDALSDCLRAWSSTLEVVRLKVREYRAPYAPLSDALATLRNLRELHVDLMEVDMDCISNLPCLSRLLCSSMASSTQLDNLTDCLEDPDKFPSLSVVAVRLGPDAAYGQRLENNCMWRSIWLQKYDDQLSSSSL